MKRLLLSLALFCASCGGVEERPVQVFADEDWTDAALTGAVAFWAAHGQEFVHGESGDLEVRSAVVPPDRIAQCGYGYIDMSPALEGTPDGAVCTVAHELGHFLGMNHVGPDADGDGEADILATPNLMAPVVSVRGDGTCYFSDLDAAELARALQAGRSACP